MKYIFLLIALFFGNVSGYSQKGITYYVALEGNDTWSGKLLVPDKGKTDGPFQTLENAVRVINEMGSKGELSGARIKVVLRKGVFEILKTLKVNDPGKEKRAASVLISNYDKEKVVLVGGKELKGFTLVKDETYLKRIKNEYRQHIYEINLKQNKIDDYGKIINRGGPGMELFFNDKRMQPARWPNVGYDTIVSVPQYGDTMYEGYVTRLDENGLPKGRHYGRFQYRGSRPDGWCNPEEIYLHGFWVFTWDDEMVAVKSIDKEKKEIILKPPHSHYGYMKGGVYYALNVLEELDRPGEWYLDRANGKLLFWPPGPITRGSLFVSLLNSTMIELENTGNIEIRGINFSKSRSAAIVIKGGENNLITGCNFNDFANIPVRIEGGVKNGVRGCELYDLSSGGIMLRGGDRRSLTPAANFVVNTHIHDFGQWLKAHQSAITINGVGNYIANNLIHHGPGTGILFSGNENIFEYNELHHIGQEMADVGAFYIGRDWTQRGNIIRYNFLHDLNGPGENYVNGVYLDDFTSGTEVYANIFLRCAKGIEIGGGRDNIISNNIFIENNLGISVDARGIDWAKYFFNGGDSALFKGMSRMNYTQPPYSEKYPVLLELYNDEPALPKNNRIFSNISYKEKWLYFYDGLDLNTVHVYDNIIGEEKGDYKNKRDYIVKGNPGILNYDKGAKIKLSEKVYLRGFKRIPFDKIGLQKDSNRKIVK